MESARDFDPPDLRMIDMSPRGMMASTSRAMPTNRPSAVSIIVSTTNPATTSRIPLEVHHRQRYCVSWPAEDTALKFPAYFLGARPNTLLNALLKAVSESYPTDFATANIFLFPSRNNAVAFCILQFVRYSIGVSPTSSLNF